MALAVVLAVAPTAADAVAPAALLALEVPASAPGVLTDGDPTRRRTGDAAERIDAPATDAPPAAATTVGDMRRNAWPGPASSRCGSPPATPRASVGLHAPAVGEVAGLRVPVADEVAGFRAPVADGVARVGVPVADEVAEFRVPVDDDVAAFRAPVTGGFVGPCPPGPARFADAALVGGA
ncbi:hypothetical protein [Cellulomonas sp. P5_C5]